MKIACSFQSCLRYCMLPLPPSLSTQLCTFLARRMIHRYLHDLNQLVLRTGAGGGEIQSSIFWYSKVILEANNTWRRIEPYSNHGLVQSIVLPPVVCCRYIIFHINDYESKFQSTPFIVAYRFPLIVYKKMSLLSSYCTNFDKRAPLDGGICFFAIISLIAFLSEEYMSRFITIFIAHFFG